MYAAFPHAEYYENSVAIGSVEPVGNLAFRWFRTCRAQVRYAHTFPSNGSLPFVLPVKVTKNSPKILCTGRRRIGDVVSTGVGLLRLGIRLQAISFDRTVRILHHLLLNIFRAPTLFTHAPVPSAFRL
jgi:hypothetical protein